MAITTTAQDILVAALGTSAKNRPEYLATNGTELLDVMTRVQRGVYAVAARVSPAYFGAAVDVPFVAPGWARPEDAEVVFRVETVDEDEVKVVDYDDREVEAYSPAIYPLGGVYRTRGTAVDPIPSDHLVLWVSRRPAAFAVLTDLLDSQWPEAYNTLLISDLAMYLAKKDGRTTDIDAQREDRNAMLAAFVRFLQTETVNKSRRDLPHDTSPTLPDLTLLLAGGA